jgi:hypothetical protein
MGWSEDWDCTLTGLVADVVVMILGDRVEPGLGEILTCTEVVVELGSTTACEILTPLTTKAPFVVAGVIITVKYEIEKISNKEPI